MYHPDILKFIHAKTDEGKMTTTNISVVVDDAFMTAVRNDEEYRTYFDFESGRIYYDTHKAKDIFTQIVEGAWKNGEPGLLFYDAINSGPYSVTGQEILASNPCGIQ